MSVLSHLDDFIALFHLHGTNSNTYKGMREKSYRINFSIMAQEAAGMSLRETECPLFVDYSVAKATLLSLFGVDDEWKEDTLLPTYFRKSTIKGARNFVGPQPSRAFFRVGAMSRFDPERNRTVLLRPREALFFLAQYRDKPPFADRRSLRFPSTATDGRTIRYASPRNEDRPDGTNVPTKATLAFVEPNVPLAENESWLLVNHVICL